jgi:hypothetical protein
LEESGFGNGQTSMPGLASSGTLPQHPNPKQKKKKKAAPFPSVLVEAARLGLKKMPLQPLV